MVQSPSSKIRPILALLSIVPLQPHGNQSLDGDSLSLKHIFMLRADISCHTAVRQIPGFPSDCESTVQEILSGMTKQHVVVGFKPDLPRGLQESLVLFQLPGVGQPFFKMARAGPGIAEIDKNPLYRILF